MYPRPISKATSFEFLTRCLHLRRVTACTKEQTVPYILSLAQNLMLKFVKLMSQYCQEMEEPSSHQSPQCVLWSEYHAFHQSGLTWDESLVGRQSGTEILPAFPEAVKQSAVWLPPL